jgi:hypothetical protein
VLVDALDAAKEPLEGALDLLRGLGVDGQRAEADRAADGQDGNVEEGA